MRSEEFRTGKLPVFAAGRELQGNTTNQTYTARHVFVTTDDVSRPGYPRAREPRPHRSRKIRRDVERGFVFGRRAEFLFSVLPPQPRRSTRTILIFSPATAAPTAPFLLNSYTWWLNDTVDGRFHLDYREKRGVGVGPDFNLHLGQWGEAQFKYYYLRDQDSGYSINTNAFENLKPIPANRQHVYFAYQATPFTNLNVKALVNYQTDPLLLHDYFEGDYIDNPQPDTFVEVQ